MPICTFYIKKIEIRGKVLFSLPEHKINAGEKWGLIGRNGSGKSTLLKLIQQASQEVVPSMERGVAVTGEAFLVLQESMVDTELPVTAELRRRWDLPPFHANMSGGERTRWKLAQAFTAEPDLLLIDEPTSHLDQAGIELLEEHLQSFSGAFILVSHDIDLLNYSVEKLFAIEKGELQTYNGNYDYYKYVRDERESKNWQEYHQYQSEKKRLEQAAVKANERSRALKSTPSRMGNSEARLHKRAVGTKKAKLSQTAKSIKSRIDQLEKKSKPFEERRLTFDAHNHPSIHRRFVMELEGYRLQIPGRDDSSPMRLSIPTGAKVAITGKNGIGKTTFIRDIYQGHENIRMAKQATPGTYDQTLGKMNDEETLLGFISKQSSYGETFIRTVLGRLGFREEVVLKPVNVLSGGEKMKATIASLFLANHHLLLLDEPSNFMDTETKEAVVDVMNDYPGTILFATHDRWLIRNVATHELPISEYRWQLIESQSGEKPSETEKSEALLKLERELTEVLSLLSIEADDKKRAELDKDFQKLIAEKKQLVQE